MFSYFLVMNERKNHLFIKQMVLEFTIAYLIFLDTFSHPPHE